MRNQQFAYAKTKTQISCAVTVHLIIAFVFGTRIVQLLIYLYPKFQASSFLLWLYSLVCVGPCRKPKLLVFSCTSSYSIFFAGYTFIYYEASLLKGRMATEISMQCKKRKQAIFRNLSNQNHLYI